MNWTARGHVMLHPRPEEAIRRQASGQRHHPVPNLHHRQAIDHPHQVALQWAQHLPHTHRYEVCPKFRCRQVTPNLTSLGIY